VDNNSLMLENARVQWQLSINHDHLPDAARAQGKTTYRSITVDGQEIEFSGGFTDLHTASYQSIINGKGYGLQDALPSVKIVKPIRDTLVERVIA
jgi:UDP-N-acetyl-2-amino-2-deoxyglucuronate dehydrogenase